jgi:outer membrane protein
MKKNTLLLVAIGAGITSGITAESAKNIKDLPKGADIRFVESFTAMRETKSGGIEGKKLEDMQNEKRKKLEGKKQKFDEEVKAHMAKADTMNDDARKKAEDKLRADQAALEKEAQEDEYELRLAMQNTTETLAKEMEEAVIEIAQKDGCDAVVDAMTGRVVYVKDSLNITKQVVKEMDKRHEKKLADNAKAAKATQVAKSDKAASTSKKTS